MLITPRLRTRPRRSRGFSLLEILVTMLIVSIASLGVAGIILAGFRATNSAADRTVATQEIASFIETMGTNLWARRNTNNLGQGYGLPFAGVIPVPACAFSSAATQCDSNDTARKHLLQLRSRVAAALPNGTVRVFASGVNQPYAIQVTVAWFDQGAVSRSGAGVTESAAALSGCAGIPIPATVNQCVTITTVSH